MGWITRYGAVAFWCWGLVVSWSAPLPIYSTLETRARVLRYKADIEISSVEMLVLEAEALDSNSIPSLAMPDFVSLPEDGVTFSNLNDPPADEFRTPGDGHHYTLSDLAMLAGDALQTTTTGFILRDRVAISPNDWLDIHNETVFVADPVTSGAHTTVPLLTIRGQLCADGLIMRAINSESENFAWHERFGILVGGRWGTDGSQAVISRSQFEGLMFGVDALSSSTVNLSDSSFTRCFHGAASLQGARMTALRCSFSEAGGDYSWVDAAGVSAALVLHDCSFSASGAGFAGAISGSSVSGCTFDGRRSGGTSRLLGLYVTQRSDVIIEHNQIRNFGCAFLGSDSSAHLDSNTIEDNLYGAVLSSFGDRSVIRRTLVRHNATRVDTGPNETTYTYPAVAIMDDATPDFGRSDDFGHNTFLNNGSLTFYMASPSTVTVCAQGNFWGTPSSSINVEAQLYHESTDLTDADQSGYLSGTILYQPILDRPCSVNSKSWVIYE